jgi:molybdenum cofactor biosynthesis enzyme MoaA
VTAMEVLEPVIGLRFLMGTACNLQCVFCHNEFQGTPKPDDKRPGFDGGFVATLVECLAAETGRLLVAKLSGGEPMMYVDEMLMVLRTIHGYASIADRIVLSNLQVPTNIDVLEQLRSLGVTTFRVNIPSLEQERYSKRTASRLSLARIARRLDQLAALGFRIEMNCVLEHAEPSKLLLAVQREVRLQEAAQYPLSLMRFILDARSARRLDSETTRLLIEAGFFKRDRRGWELGGRTPTVVTRCDDWSEDPLDADKYIRPPGVLMQSYAAGRASYARGRRVLNVSTRKSV